MKTLTRYMGKYRFQSIMAPLLKMAEALFDLFVPLVMARLINTGIGNNDREYILKQTGVSIFRYLYKPGRYVTTVALANDASITEDSILTVTSSGWYWLHLVWQLAVIAGAVWGICRLIKARRKNG